METFLAGARPLEITAVSFSVCRAFHTSRARAYGLTVAQYKTNNLLKTEVTSRDVAELAAEMCGPLFAKTTAAQVPVDGGNDRVI